MINLSVIVPVYNVEKYLKKCIDSILNQTYQNFELILIDDGSTDNSPIICDEYSLKDEKVKVIHQENLGLSGARNKGINVSLGEFVLFIDSDDYLDLDYFEKIISISVEKNIDIVISGKYYENEKFEIFKQTGNIEKGYISREDVLKKMLIFDNIDTSFCDKLFKKKLFNDISFPVGRYYEDLATMYKIIEKTGHIYVLGESKYHYILRDNSITNSKFSNKNLDMIDFSYELYNHIINKYKNLTEEANIFLCYQLSRILQDLYLYDKEGKYKSVKIKYKKQYNKIIKKVLISSKVSFKKKILLLLVYFNFYKIVFIFKSR